MDSSTPKDDDGSPSRTCSCSSLNPDGRIPSVSDIAAASAAPSPSHPRPRLPGFYGFLTDAEGAALARLWLLLAACLASPAALADAIRAHVPPASADPFAALAAFDAEPEATPVSDAWKCATAATAATTAAASSSTATITPDAPPIPIPDCTLLDTIMFHLAYNLGLTPPDALLLRFLRARKFSPDLALAMLLRTLLFQVSVGLTNIIKRGDAAFPAAQFRGKFVHKCDVNGLPIVYNRVKLHDKSLNSVAGTRKHLIFLMETLRLFVRFPNERVAVVFDLAGSGMNNMDLELTKYLVKILQDYYPESLGAAYIVNAPFFFRGLWAIIKPFFEPKVAAKIFFVKHSDLPKYIARENLPSCFPEGQDDSAAHEFIPQAARPEDPTPEEKLAPLRGDMARAARLILDAGAAWAAEHAKEYPFTGETAVPSPTLDIKADDSDATLSRKHVCEPAETCARDHLHACYLAFEASERTPSFYHRLGVLSTPDKPVNWSCLTPSAAAE